MERHLAEVEDVIRRKHFEKSLELTEQKHLTDTGTTRNTTYAHVVSETLFAHSVYVCINIQVKRVYGLEPVLCGCISTSVNVDEHQMLRVNGLLPVNTLCVNTCYM